MASILDRYGIKEVADVTFYKIKDDGSVGDPVLVLDTLKVSTIEQTAEQVDARGGKGNPKLITWDYGKEISVTIEDALFSPKSMAIIFGNGVATAKAIATNTRTIMTRLVAKGTGAAATQGAFDYLIADVYDSAEGGGVRKKIDMKDTTPRAGMVAYNTTLLVPTCITDEHGTAHTLDDTPTMDEMQDIAATLAPGEKVFVTYTQKVEKSEIIVNGDTFPGTYYIVGDTYSRSDVTGKDSFFQFIIPKAKMSADETITLQAEGDPTTFNMNLTVLRPEDGDMLKLVQYDLVYPANG